jgi:Holliday junction DNA helicase RuvA
MKKYLLITIILLISCSQNNFKPFDLFDLKEKEIVIKNKIKEIREIEIAIDTAGVSLWKRVTNIKHYNKDGNLTLSLTPNYLRKPLPDFGTSDENNSIFVDNKVREESLSALEVLGISRKMCEKIADRILKQNPDIQTEDLVKQILKNL